jgi:hypothetical protein
MSQRRREETAEPNPEEQMEVSEQVLDLYVDSLHISTGLYSSILYLGELRPGQKPLLRARIKVSPQMLRAISLLSAKHVRDLERAVGTIGLPNELVHSWGLEEEVK